MLHRYELHATVPTSVKRSLPGTRPKRRVKDSIEREQNIPGKYHGGFPYNRKN